MRVAMIGTGYVGLVSGVCFADFGHQVLCVDKDAHKIRCSKRVVSPFLSRVWMIWWPKMWPKTVLSFQRI